MFGLIAAFIMWCVLGVLANISRNRKDFSKRKNTYLSIKYQNYFYAGIPRRGAVIRAQ